MYDQFSLVVPRQMIEHQSLVGLHLNHTELSTFPLINHLDSLQMYILYFEVKDKFCPIIVQSFSNCFSFKAVGVPPPTNIDCSVFVGRFR